MNKLAQFELNFVGAIFGVIGGLIAIVLWARKHRLPLLPIADSVTPAFFIGLAFGRIGCLLNGCCYGG